MTSVGGKGDAVAQLVSLAMKLFHKMVDSGAPFHLTLINVCFSNLQSRTAASSVKGSIASFFAQSNSTPAFSTQGKVLVKRSVLKCLTVLCGFFFSFKEHLHAL